MATKAVVSSSVKKVLSMRELENLPGHAVFVVNTSPRNLRGDIIFSAPKLSGNSADVVRIVKTWIPQDLSEQVPRAQLMASSEFRKTVRNGLCQLIHPVYAERVLETEDAIAEQTKINNLRNAARAMARAEETTGDDEGDTRRTPTKDRRTRNQAHAAANPKTEMTDSQGEDPFNVFLTSLENKKETDILNALRNEGQFTKKELKKARKAFIDHTRVVRWIDKKIESLDE